MVAAPPGGTELGSGRKCPTSGNGASLDLHLDPLLVDLRLPVDLRGNPPTTTVPLVGRETTTILATLTAAGSCSPTERAPGINRDLLTTE